MTWNRYLTYIWTWPFDLIVWLVWLVLAAMWGEKLRWEDGCLVFNLKQDSWPARTWYAPWGGTCMGHAIFYNWYVTNREDGSWSSIQVHEHVHVEQYEVSMLSAFVVALLVFLTVGIAHGLWGTGAILGSIIWFFGYFLMAGASWLTAVVRGEDYYRGSQHEEAAYAVQAEYERHS